MFINNINFYELLSNNDTFLIKILNTKNVKIESLVPANMFEYKSQDVICNKHSIFFNPINVDTMAIGVLLFANKSNYVFECHYNQNHYFPIIKFENVVIRTSKLNIYKNK